MPKALRLAITVLVLGLGFGYALAVWNPPNPATPPTGPGDPNAPEPLDVSATPQVKDGGLGLGGILRVIGTSNRLYVDGKVGIGPAATTSIDATALLDVDGQIRVRGPLTPPEYAPAAGRVLTSIDTSGLARWQANASGIISITESTTTDAIVDPVPSGLTLTPDPITNNGTIAINENETQRRVAPGCPLLGAMTGIAPSGVPTCNNYVMSVEAPDGSPPGSSSVSGLWGAPDPRSGAVTLGVNVGTAPDNTGLRIDPDNKVKINVNTALGDGDGLTVDATTNTLRFEPCAPGETWKYVGSSWTCDSFPPVPPAPSSQPGESIMYLRARSTGGSTNPLPCPPGWSEVTNPSLSWTSNENVGGANFNRTRVCYRSDLSCQTLYLRSTSASSPAPASCPAVTGMVNLGVSEELAPGGATINYTRTCYVCN